MLQRGPRLKLPLLATFYQSFFRGYGKSVVVVSVPRPGVIFVGGFLWVRIQKDGEWVNHLENVHKITSYATRQVKEFPPKTHLHSPTSWRVVRTLLFLCTFYRHQKSIEKIFFGVQTGHATSSKKTLYYTGKV